MINSWKPVPLKDIGKWYSGGTPSKVKSEYWGGTIPWISASSMHKVYVHDSQIRVTELGSQNGTRKVPENTVLLLVRGSMLFKRIPVCLTTRPVTFNQDVKAIITNKHILPRFLLYSLSFNEDKLMGFVEPTGIGAGKLSTDILHRFKIPLPPIEEQRKIAEILSTWDEAIALTERMIAALERRKKGLMQRLLTGQVRFPRFTEEWKEVRLGDVCTTFSGGTPSRGRNEYYVGTIPWIKSGEINQEHITQTEEKISQEALNNSSAKMVSSGTVLVALYGATAGKIGISELDAAINQALLAVIPNGKVIPCFLFYVLQTYSQAMLKKVQGGQPNLNAGIVKSTKMLIPSIDEQERIEKVFIQIDVELSLRKNQLEIWRNQKKGLMQRLLTGEVRV